MQEQSSGRHLSMHHTAMLEKFSGGVWREAGRDKVTFVKSNTGKSGPRQGCNSVDFVLPQNTQLAGSHTRGYNQPGSWRYRVCVNVASCASVSSTLLFGSMTAMSTTIAATSCIPFTSICAEVSQGTSDKVPFLRR